MSSIAPPDELSQSVKSSVSLIANVDDAAAKIVALPAPQIVDPLTELYKDIAQIYGLQPPQNADGIPAFWKSYSEKYHQNREPTADEIQQLTQEHAKLFGIDLNRKPDQTKLEIASARNHAKQWSDSIRPELVKTLQSVGNFSTVFDSDYSDLEKACSLIQTGDVSGIAAFKEILKKWQVETSSMQATASSVNDAISGLRDDISADVRSLTSDLINQQAAAKAALAAIPVLNAHITEVQNKIDAENQAYSTLGVLGAEIKQYMLQLTGQLSLFTDQLDNANQAVTDAQNKADAAKATADLISSYMALTDTSTTALQNLINGLTLLSGQFSILSEAEDIQSFSVFTEGQLKNAKQQWETIQEMLASTN